MKLLGAYRWYVVITLMIGYFFAFLDRTIIGLMVEPIQSDLNINDTQMSLLMGLAFVLLYSVAAIPLGFVADRMNRVRLISIGAAVWCFTTVACGLANTYWQLFLARLAVGLGEATLAPAANSLIGDYFKANEIGRALTVFNLGIAAGAAFSLILGGQVLASIATFGELSFPIVGNRQPWQVVFMSVGLAGVLFIVMMLFVREPERTGRSSSRESLTFQQTLAFLQTHGKLYFSLFFGQAATAIVGFAAYSWMPTFFMRTQGWTAAEAGVRYGATSLAATVLGMIASGWLIDRWYKKGRQDAAWKVFTLGVGAFLPALLVGPLLDIPSLSLTLVFVGVFGASMGTIAAPTAIISATPNEARGVAVAVYLLIVNLFGAAVGPTAVALLTDYVFADKLAVGMSIAVVGGLGWLGALGAALYGTAAYRARVARIDAAGSDAERFDAA